MMQRSHPERGVSEQIGAILLVSVVVLMVAIIGVTLSSQPPPQNIPSMKAMIWNDSGKIYIKHGGGDPLYASDIRILVNGNDETAKFNLSTEPNTPWDIWPIGHILAAPISSPSVTSVQVIYSTGSSAFVLASAGQAFGGTVSGTVIPTGTPTSGISHTITASAGPGGSISPAGAVTIESGGSQSFAISADPGYTVADVVVDGISQGSIGSYPFEGVTSDHSISASFIRVYTITSTASSGGSISPSGSILIAAGGSQTYTITPDPGKSIVDVLVDGVPAGPVATYSFTGVNADHTIAASFVTNTHTITAAAGTGGSISPSGAVSVPEGAGQSFAIAPSAGYHMVDVLVDGVSNGTVTSYTFTNVLTDHTISASFAINTFNITSSATPGGTISPDGVTVVDYGGSQTYAITPDPGRQLNDVLVDGVSAGKVTTYTFSSVMADHTISAAFLKTKYTITASAGTGGTITPEGAVNVYYGTDQSFSITNSTGYHVYNVMVDGISRGAIADYTFTNVVAPHTISASFAADPVITASAGSGGSISPSGTTRVNYDGSLAYSITPSAGYHIADVTVDGSPVGAVSGYTFTNVISDHTISATFALNTYTLTAGAGTGGSITPSGAIIAGYGSDRTFSVTPDTGYSISDVLVDGTSVGAVNSYTFSNVQADHTIQALFAMHTYTITAGAGIGGSISPSGSIPVSYGNSQTFTITPYTGYAISSVVVDGSPAGTPSSYTFTNVQAAHSIYASFAASTYTITPSAGSGGTISPSSPVDVTAGGSQTFTIIPNTGYSVQTVYVDGVSVGAVTSYTFTNVQAAHTIYAAFATTTYTITASAGTGGSISPSGAVSVAYGSSKTFTITPNTGYTISDVKVDGISVGAVTTYTFSNVLDDHTISATFAIRTFAISESWSPGSRGYVSISPPSALSNPGSVTVNYGASQTFYFVPASGRRVSSYTIDGVKTTVNGVTGVTYTYTFNTVVSTHTVVVVFA